MLPAEEDDDAEGAALLLEPAEPPPPPPLLLPVLAPFRPRPSLEDGEEEDEDERDVPAVSEDGDGSRLLGAAGREGGEGSAAAVPLDGSVMEPRLPPMLRLDCEGDE